MMELLTAGLSLLWTPSRAWRRIGELPSDTTTLVGYAITLSILPLMFRLAGHFLSKQLSVGAAFADSLLFVIILLGSASGAGVLVAAVARKMGADIPDIIAQKLVLLSATPVFVMGLIYAVPFPERVWPYILLFSLGWGSFLLFRGLWSFSSLDARGVTVVSLTGACAWILSSTILSQVLLLILTPR